MCNCSAGTCGASCCKIPTEDLCHIIDTKVDSYLIDFVDIPITDVQFIYESSLLNGKNVVKKGTPGTGFSGLTIVNDHILSIDGFVEKRKEGLHIAYLRAIDNDGNNIIFSWRITVKSTK